MIIEWFLGVAVGFLEWVVGALPVLAVPTWVNPGIGDGLMTVAGYMTGTAIWFPVELILGVAVAIAAATLVGFAVKFARIVLSLFTAGGGSAA